MQWNSLLKTKLVLAGLLVALVAGDSLARPGDRLFGRRNSYYYDTPVQQYQVVPVTQTTQQPVQAMPVAAVPATTVQPAQPAQAQAQPVVQQPVLQTEPQYTTQRRGLFGRRTQVVQTPVQQAQPMVPGTTTTPTTGNNNRQSFYPAPGNQQSLIEVRLPVANAEVLFNGTATTQTGVNRMFITPALEATGENRYEVTIRYTENGNPVEQKREIKAAPGGRLVVDFTQPQQAQPQQPLQAPPAQPQQPQQPQPEQP